MQIITLEHAIFPEVSEAWKEAQDIGHFWKDGKQRSVKASSKFIIIGTTNEAGKFAFKPTQSLEEAISLATHLLKREEKRGNSVSFEAKL
jgi:hypothetical protein